MADVKYNRILMMSDLHLCHIDWFGMTSEERLTKMVQQLNQEYAKRPYDMILCLGDYSLDFWVFSIGGSYLRDNHTSNTTKMVRDYLSQLPAPVYMIPGNHEQYAPETWKSITGFDRQFAVPYGNHVFIMLDNFSGNLGPNFNSDGTYTPTDVAYVRSVMAQYPGKKYYLCAHDFYLDEETDEFKKLLADPDVMAIFGGHTHESKIFSLGPVFGQKCLIRTGNYSYCNTDEKCVSWGWREMCFHDDKRLVTTEYVLPKTQCIFKNVPSSHEAYRRDGIELRY